jgi:hypothetical protein
MMRVLGGEIRRAECCPVNEHVTAMVTAARTNTGSESLRCSAFEVESNDRMAMRKFEEKDARSVWIDAAVVG